MHTRSTSRPWAAPALSLFGFTLRQTAGERRSILAILLMLSPAPFALLIRWANPNAAAPEAWEAYHGLAIYMLLGGVLPLTAMLLGPALITAESERGTLVYLFTRRLKRWQTLLVRFAAQTVVLAALGILAAGVLHLSILVGLDKGTVSANWPAATPAAELRAYIGVMPWAAAGFLAVFAVISLLTSKALLVSGLYVVFVEIVIGNVPAVVRTYTISHQLRRSLAGAMPHIQKMLGPNAELNAELYPAGGSGTFTLAIVVAVLLLVGAVLTTRKELSARSAGGD